MVSPVQVSPLIKFGRYSALVIGMDYGAKRYSYLKPRAEEERRIAAEEKRLDELKCIERELADLEMTAFSSEAPVNLSLVAEDE